MAFTTKSACWSVHSWFKSLVKGWVFCLFICMNRRSALLHLAVSWIDPPGGQDRESGCSSWKKVKESQQEIDGRIVGNWLFLPGAVSFNLLFSGLQSSEFTSEHVELQLNHSDSFTAGVSQMLTLDPIFFSYTSAQNISDWLNTAPSETQNWESHIPNMSFLKCSHWNIAVV